MIEQAKYTPLRPPLRVPDPPAAPPERVCAVCTQPIAGQGRWRYCEAHYSHFRRTWEQKHRAERLLYFRRLHAARRPERLLYFRQRRAERKAQHAG